MIKLYDSTIGTVQDHHSLTEIQYNCTLANDIGYSLCVLVHDFLIISIFYSFF